MTIEKQWIQPVLLLLSVTKQAIFLHDVPFLGFTVPKLTFTVKPVKDFTLILLSLDWLKALKNKDFTKKPVKYLTGT